jgi:putative ABC transport system substrate-binding protein
MKRIVLLLSISVLAIVILASVPLAQAQQTGKIHRIAYLSSNVARIPHRIEAFRQAMRDLGYVEGKNIVIELRSGRVKRGRKAKPSHYRTVAAELVRLKVDVIVTGGGGATRRAKEATSTIPIVMTQDRDPVGNGHVASLARPGGNITGLSRLAPELGTKQLELLKEIVPRLSRVAAFWSSTNRTGASMRKEIKLAAGALGLKLQSLNVEGPMDIEPAFREASKWYAEAALWLVPNPFYNSNRTQVAELAVKSRLPVIHNRRIDVEAGGLISYGVNFTDMDRRAAIYVDKILKGAKPAELPVERPRKFDLVINLKTAKQIGLTIPPEILIRAAKVIK